MPVYETLDYSFIGRHSESSRAWPVSMGFGIGPPVRPMRDSQMGRHWETDRCLNPAFVLGYRAFIDDATSKLMKLRLVPSESTDSHFGALQGYLNDHGWPCRVYSDKHTVFRVNKPNAKGGSGIHEKRNFHALLTSRHLMDPKALLDLWKMDEIPACGEGMKPAQGFLISCGRAVDRLGLEAPADHIIQTTAAYMALVEHGDGCDSCNED
jgi:hypothetical protein